MLAGIALLLAFARAEPVVPPPLDAPLVWEAPASCPSQDDVATALDAAVPHGAVRVRAKVEPSADLLVADVELVSVHGTTKRRLQSPSCTSVVDALVLLARIAAEPLPTIEHIAPPPPEPVVPPPVAAPPLELEPAVVPPIGSPAPPPVQPRRRDPRLRARIGAAAIVGGGTLPGLDAGVRGFAGLASRWVLVDVGAQYLAPRSVDALPPDVAVRVDAWAIALRVCPVIPLPSRRLELAVCAVGSAGRLRGSASGDGLRTGSSDAVPLFGLAAAPQLAIAVHPRVRLVASLEAGGHPLRPGFRIAGQGQVWAPERWSAHGVAGLEVRLP